MATSTERKQKLSLVQGIIVWSRWTEERSRALSLEVGQPVVFGKHPCNCTPVELNELLCRFMEEVRKPDGERYDAGYMFFMLLSIQNYMYSDGVLRANMFFDHRFGEFRDRFQSYLRDDEAREGSPTIFEEEMLWGAHLLGSHSAYSLLYWTVYYNTKRLRAVTVEDHMKLSFLNMRRMIRSTPARSFEEEEVHPDGYEYRERDPHVLFDLYESKCTFNCTYRDDAVYFVPAEDFIPQNAVWFTEEKLSQDDLNLILQKFRFIEELQLVQTID